MAFIEDMGVAIAEGFTKKLDVSTITVFLAGRGFGLGDSVRPLLRKELRGRRYVRGYDVLYPEELFDELMSKKTGHDLLSLENILADSAHAVIIIVESPGSIAELSSFVSDEVLRKKLIAVVNRKHRDDKSFIMLGPVALLRSIRREAVILHDLGNPDPAKLADDVRRAVRHIMSDTKVDDSLNNPIRAQYFILASVFIAEPVTLQDLTKLLAATGQCDLGRVRIVGTTALNILLRQGYISLATSAMGYRLTQRGSRRIGDIIRASKDGRQFVHLFDKYRVEMLNMTLRNKLIRQRLLIGEGALS